MKVGSLPSVMFCWRVPRRKVFFWGRVGDEGEDGEGESEGEGEDEGRAGVSASLERGKSRKRGKVEKVVRLGNMIVFFRYI